IFDNPLAAIVRYPKSKARRGDETPIAKGLNVADANESAPCPRADNWSDFLTVEKPRKSVAARAGKLVDDHYFRTKNPYRRPRNIFRVARRDEREQLALQLLRVQVGKRDAGVPPLIHDDAISTKPGG